MENNKSAVGSSILWLQVIQTNSQVPFLELRGLPTTNPQSLTEGSLEAVNASKE